MASNSPALQKLQEYAKKVKDTRYDSHAGVGRLEYESQLQVVHKDLSDRLREEETALQQLKQSVQSEAIDTPSSDPRTRLHQLRTIKLAYEQLTDAQPNLPHPESPLPALLVTRSTQRLITEIEESIRATHTTILGSRTRLAEEHAELRDARVLTETLTNRIVRLQVAVQEKSQETPEEAAHRTIAHEENRKRSYEKETKKLVKALVQFIHDHLAAMLAAEERGGPIVGDLLDVSDDMLAAGFSRLGKAKKGPSEACSDRRTRHPPHNPRRGDPGDAEGAVEARTDRQAAAAEMIALAEDLLNVAAEDGPGAYATLDRDSAASRFLVRAKAAQFHPNDARKLRLIDFGRTLDD